MHTRRSQSGEKCEGNLKFFNAYRYPQGAKSLYNSHFGPYVQNVANMRVIMAILKLCCFTSNYPHLKHKWIVWGPKFRLHWLKTVNRLPITMKELSSYWSPRLKQKMRLTSFLTHKGSCWPQIFHQFYYTMIDISL